MNTKLVAEYLYHKRLITEVHPTGLVGTVSDTYNLWDVLTKIAPALKDEIMARDGKVVFRPDSGDPVDILCGTFQGESYVSEEDFVEDIYEECSGMCGQGETGPWEITRVVNIGGKIVKAHVTITYTGDKQDRGDRLYFVDQVHLVSVEKHELTNEEKGAVQILWEQFGGTTNEKGYKELDIHVGLIYGDSITLERCEAICQRLKDKGFSSGNVVFGVGSYTYQMITRDTFGMAMKATYCEVNGEGREIFKDPITDDGIKKSATGLLMVVSNRKNQYEVDKNKPLTMVDKVTWDDVNSDLNELKVVFEDGSVKCGLQTLSQIRERVAKSF